MVGETVDLSNNDGRTGASNHILKIGKFPYMNLRKGRANPTYLRKIEVISVPEINHNIH